jgi:hypothetical protein
MEPGLDQAGSEAVLQVVEPVFEAAVPYPGEKLLAYLFEETRFLKVV